MRGHTGGTGVGKKGKERRKDGKRETDRERQGQRH